MRLAWVWTIPALICCSKPVAEKPTTVATQQSSQESGADAGAGEGSGAEKVPEQTYQEAWTIICNAQQLSGVDPQLPTTEYNSEVVNWLVAHLKNQKARLWFLEYDKVKPEYKRAHFETEAKKVGFDDCQLTTLLFPPDAEPASPEQIN